MGRTVAKVASSKSPAYLVRFIRFASDRRFPPAIAPDGASRGGSTSAGEPVTRESVVTRFEARLPCKCPVWLINQVERGARHLRYSFWVENRRRNVRIRASLRFTFAWSDGKDAVTDEPREFFELFRTIDVSAGGARVTQHVSGGLRPRVGVTGQAAFVLDGVEVRTEATVVRALNDGFAVRFRSLSQPDESRVVAWIFRQEALALSRRIPA